MIIMNDENVKGQNFLEAKNFLLTTGLMKHGCPINSFDAYVEYRFFKRTICGTANVSITMEDTAHNGDIEIDGSGFDKNIVHTGFSTTWQRYEFDRESKKIIIRGSSPLMGNNYEVEISPL